jgi:hypothetical protein
MYQEPQNGNQNMLIIGMVLFAVVIGIQATMLTAVAKCRHFLSKRQMHLVAMRVAEKSVRLEPPMHLLVSSFSGNRIRHCELLS